MDWSTFLTYLLARRYGVVMNKVRRARIAANALRSAAEDLRGSDPSVYPVVKWLEDRADRIEEEVRRTIDPTKLCLHRHRLPSREIPCAECVAAFDNKE